jgi:translation initiation factor 1
MDSIYFFNIFEAQKQQKRPTLMKNNNNWKERLNIVYSTNPDFKYHTDEESETQTLPKEKQLLRIELDKRNRKGKSVTLITNFTGSDKDLQDLSKLLKTKCGVGGSARDGEILLQGDFRSKVLELLQKEGYVKSRIIG